MGIFESISSSINNILNYKVRSFLTVLGIIIGVSSVVIINFAGEGVRSYIMGKLENMSRPILKVAVNKFSDLEKNEDIELTLEDVESISKMPGVKSVAPVLTIYNKKTKLKNKEEFKTSSILGVSENYKIIENINILRGRSFTKKDIENKSYFGLMPEKVALKLFGNVNIIGKKIEIIDEYDQKETDCFTIIGVIKDFERSMYIDNDSILFIPITLASKLNSEKTEKKEHIKECFIEYDKKDFKVETIMENIKIMLTKRHNLKEQCYECTKCFDEHKEFNKIFSNTKAFITFVAGISLFVAGIGVMNIMLVTVAERTREIGIRKALGATNNIIKLQFLIESSLLTSLGGIIGGIFGILFSNLICIICSNIFEIELIAKINLFMILKLILLSYILGVIFGVYPAGKAAKLDPVNSLRYK